MSQYTVIVTHSYHDGWDETNGQKTVHVSASSPQSAALEGVVIAQAELSQSSLYRPSSAQATAVFEGHLSNLLADA